MKTYILLHIANRNLEKFLKKSSNPKRIKFYCNVIILQNILFVRVQSFYFIECFRLSIRFGRCHCSSNWSPLSPLFLQCNTKKTHVHSHTTTSCDLWVLTLGLKVSKLTPRWHKTFSAGCQRGGGWTGQLLISCRPSLPLLHKMWYMWQQAGGALKVTFLRGVTNTSPAANSVMSHHPPLIFASFQPHVYVVYFV